MPKTVTCIDINGQTFTVPVEKLIWRPSAYGFVVKEGKLLLSKQFDGYDLPGGGIDLGETPEQAVVREVEEETGIITKDPKLIAVATSFFRPFSKSGFYQSIMLYYQCDFIGGALSMDGFDEHEKIYAGMPEWISLKTLENVKPASTNDYRQYIKELKL